MPKKTMKIPSARVLVVILSAVQESTKINTPHINTTMPRALLKLFALIKTSFPLIVTQAKEVVNSWLWSDYQKGRWKLKLCRHGQILPIGFFWQLGLLNYPE